MMCFGTIARRLPSQSPDHALAGEQIAIETKEPETGSQFTFAGKNGMRIQN
jgi:hypothetical protein